MHRLLTLGPRFGFALLLAVLVGFELLFIAEARAGATALEAERTLREERAAKTLEDELLGSLDVAEARLEALETLPLVEEDGLLLVREGVQYFPRIPGAAGAVKGEEALEKTAWTPELGKALEKSSVNPALRLQLLLSVLERAPNEWVGESGQSLALSAWPWLERQQAGRACVLLQRRGDELGLKTERFSAACKRGLSSTTISLSPDGERVGVRGLEKPRLVGDWLMVQRAGEIRGVQIDLPRQLDELKKTLLKRGMMEAGEQVHTSSARAESLVGLHLESPRLDSAHASLRDAMWWKTLLLALTLLLGLGVVLLARLAEQREEETLAVQREFIATVSHELRTPLAGIRLMAETLERKLGEESAAKDYPRRLVVAADGLGFLVENILSFNRLESGRWVPRREPFSFGSLEPLLKDDASLAVDATVEVRCEGLERMAAHQLDAQLIRVLVQNLLRNAWKYGRRQPVVFTVSGRDEDGVAVLRFADNGPGIPSEERERVFEAFHRLPAEEGRAVGGSGLGLALARRIAVLHGGTLMIAKSTDEGTEFELRLPRLR